MSADERRARAYAARALISDPTLQEGWEHIENDLRSQWEACWWPRKRNRIWADLRHLKQLRQRLSVFAGQSRD